MYDPGDKLMAALFQFIVAHLTDDSDMINIRKAWNFLDNDNDGILGYQEIYSGFHKMYGSDAAQKITDDIFAKIDSDGNGTIEWSEFVIAAIDKRKFLSEKKLR